MAYWIIRDDIISYIDPVSEEFLHSTPPVDTLTPNRGIEIYLSEDYQLPTLSLPYYEGDLFLWYILNPSEWLTKGYLNDLELLENNLYDSLYGHIIANQFHNPRNPNSDPINTLYWGESFRDSWETAAKFLTDNNLQEYLLYSSAYHTAFPMHPNERRTLNTHEIVITNHGIFFNLAKRIIFNYQAAIDRSRTTLSTDLQRDIVLAAFNISNAMYPSTGFGSPPPDWMKPF